MTKHDAMTQPQKDWFSHNFRGDFTDYMHLISKDMARKFIGEVLIIQKAQPDPVLRQKAKNRMRDQLLNKLKPEECSVCGGSKSATCHC